MHERHVDSGLRPLDRWMGAIAAVLLAIYFLLALHAGFSPSTDPQRGMADGFVVLSALTLLLIACVLWFGIARRRPWVIRVIFVLSAYPALSWIAQQVYLSTRHVS